MQTRFLGEDCISLLTFLAKIVYARFALQFVHRPNSIHSQLDMLLEMSMEKDFKGILYYDQNM